MHNGPQKKISAIVDYSNMSCQHKGLVIDYPSSCVHYSAILNGTSFQIFDHVMQAAGWFSFLSDSVYTSVNPLS